MKGFKKAEDILESIRIDFFSQLLSILPLSPKSTSLSSFPSTNTAAAGVVVATSTAAAGVFGTIPSPPRHFFVSYFSFPSSSSFLFSSAISFLLIEVQFEKPPTLHLLPSTYQTQPPTLHLLPQPPNYPNLLPSTSSPPPPTLHLLHFLPSTSYHLLPSTSPLPTLHLPIPSMKRCREGWLLEKLECLYLRPREVTPCVEPFTCNHFFHSNSQ